MSESESFDLTARTGRSTRSDVSTLKSSRFSVQEDHSEYGDKAEVYERLSPTHEKLLNALKSSEVLHAIHVDVRNDSYWYHMRKRLGPKKHGALIVKQNPNTLRWEAYIFKMKLREEDMEVVPTKTLISNHKTKWSAYKAAEAACKERDANPAKNKKIGEITNPDKILSTHFRIQVVSDKFDHINTIQRHFLIYQELVKAIGVNIIPEQHQLRQLSEQSTTTNTTTVHDFKKGIARCPPTKLKLGSIYGQNMCSLNLFRFLLPDDHAPYTLRIDCRTPSQWKPSIYKPPLSERLGSTHNTIRSLGIDNSAKPRSHLSRVKKLTTVVSHELLHQQELTKHHVSTVGVKHGSILEEDEHFSGTAALNPSKYMDSIGLDPAVSGVKYKKLGGIYGHFFNDLSSEIKELVMSKYKDNKHLIRDESNAEIMQFHTQNKKNIQENTVSNTPQTNISKMRLKQQAATLSGEYDKGTSSELEMLEEINIKNLKIEKIVIRLQYIRRQYIWYKSIKLLWKYEYNVITIQRYLRGYYNRLYMKLYKNLKPKAIIRIQRFYRNCQSRVFLRIWQYIVYKLTRIILPKIKKFIKNCYLSWLFRRNIYAIKIQSIIRGFLGRCYYYKKYGVQYYYNIIFPTAVIKIQSIIRGFLSRCYIKIHINNILHINIVIPAIIRIQRIYRGRLAKLILKQLKIRAKAIYTLQIHIRAFIHRIWAHQVYLELQRKLASITIQRNYRGRLDRQLYRMKAHKYWYYNKYIPAIIYIQAVTRRYHAIKYITLLKKQNISVYIIQKYYKDYCDRKLARNIVQNLRKMREFHSAAMIQRIIRRRLAILRVRRMVIEYKGRIITAGKVIMRAWTNYLLK